MPVRFLLSDTGWEINHWDKQECTAVPQTDGKIAIIDHSIQTRVAEADTIEEARQWLGKSYREWELEYDMDKDEYTVTTTHPETGVPVRLQLEVAQHDDHNSKHRRMVIMESVEELNRKQREFYADLDDLNPHYFDNSEPWQREGTP